LYDLLQLIKIQKSSEKNISERAHREKKKNIATTYSQFVQMVRNL